MQHPSIWYDIEDDIKDLTVEEKYNRRQEEAVPLWEQFIACANKIIGDGMNFTGEGLYQPVDAAKITVLDFPSCTINLPLHATPITPEDPLVPLIFLPVISVFPFKSEGQHHQ